MARIAIIHIADDHTADGITSDEIKWPAGSRLVGLFNYPTKDELQCDGTCRGRGARAHSVRGEDGSMECSSCGSKHPIIRQLLMRAFRDYLGPNLFKKAPKAFQTIAPR